MHHSATPPAPHGVHRAGPRPLLMAGALAMLCAIGGLAPLAAPIHAAEPPPAARKTETGTTAATPTPVGSWLLEDIEDGPVIDRVRTELTISADGQAYGSGGCNRFMGKSVLAGEKLTIGPAAATRMACPPAVMEQEARFLKILEQVQGWRVDAAEDKLHLLDGDGATLLIFSATTPQK